ncbi:MAG: DinB family protein [Acidobacteriota bacterium]|nr:DinB family protein [Acidobacteriota bacterium]
MNPYRLFLGDQRAMDVIQTTPESLRELVNTIGPAGWDQTYAPGKWTARQIVCHLADCEIAFGFRLRQAIAEEHHVIQPFDQSAWAAPYANFDVQAALNAFIALRQWNLIFAGSLSPEQLRKPLTHPERGEMALQVILDTMGGHDRNHMAQLEIIRSNQHQGS